MQYAIDILCFALLISCSISAQDILIDDVNTVWDWDWDTYTDTLTSNGAAIHYVSFEGWTDIMNMDMLWIPKLLNDAYYDSPTKSILQCFVRDGGRIVIWHSDQWTLPTNDLLTDTGWETTMEIFDMGIHCQEQIRCTFSFSPFTDNVDSLITIGPTIISCGEHAYPFAFIDSFCSQAIVAMSYPFLHEENCSSYILLVTGTYAFTWSPCRDSGYFADKGRFASNILLTAAGVPGYELEPGAIPGGGNACEEIPEEYYCTRVPNLFTPNEDGFNDYCQFEFDGMGNSEGTIYIYNIHGHEVKQINVPEGANAKTAAQWHGTDNHGNPLPQGVYMYVIESGGEIVCEGTVVIAR